MQNTPTPKIEKKEYVSTPKKTIQITNTTFGNIGKQETTTTNPDSASPAHIEILKKSTEKKPEVQNKLQTKFDTFVEKNAFVKQLQDKFNFKPM